MSPLRVVKLGGSLLDWPALPAALVNWHQRQPAAATVLIVGGGGLVERLRQLDRLHPLSSDASHWLAIRAMGITARLVAEWLNLPVLTDPRQLDRASRELQPLDVEPLLRSDDAHPDALPHSWSVTSDSIAARVAKVLGADELVLLKSAPPPAAIPPAGSLLAAAASEQGDYCDAHFPVASLGLRIRLVNLREAV